ncbi:glycosyl transferase family 1 [Streptomyces viridochromogenes]|uniref:Glycosyl transferase family 1 n=1 Tax=Streptomyces viridochromogenes TaxID=1938 RepID=A0A0J7Z3H1_STRVR|nr:glycosyltransferase [Streptomyces viridochromogenes]KMS70354.1 glycosyl transferase family 1 [Streptomyces viridochromogenes]KOG17110.1 glycosyl transferase family 1 [Streptomyces viridochromogenes]KOG20131.1 glycosyl transferase family 1 [Streptomyces viridochromogenes]
MRVAPHILHVAQPVEAGVARVVTDLVAAQLAAGLRVSAACPEGGTLADGLRALGCTVAPWDVTRAPGPRLPGEVRQLARVVRGVRPDLVHAHSAKAGLAARLAVRGGLPTVFQPHAWSFEAADGAVARLALGWERFGARWAARVLCVSEAERRTGVRAGIDAEWRVVPNGVDTRRFRPEGERAPAGAGPLVVCVGRLCRQKGQDVLLAAWPEVVRQVAGARLVLVGDGPDAGRLRSGAPASVEFVGTTADTAPWYRAADVVVLPSRWEGMALAPLEAMACARPVVVTDVDGAGESLPAGHPPSCLVPSEDPGALARALTTLLLDEPLRAALGAQGRAHVLVAHDPRRAADAVTGVYRELLGLATTRVVGPNGGRKCITT